MENLFKSHFSTIVYRICVGLKKSNLLNHCIMYCTDPEQFIFKVDIDQEGVQVYHGTFTNDGHFFITDKEGRYLYRGYIKVAHLPMLSEIIETVLWSDEEEE